MTEPTNDTPPRLTVVSGAPTPEELAALAAVMSVAAAEPSAPVERIRRGGWNDPAHGHRRPLLPGPNGWRAAAR